MELVKLIEVADIIAGQSPPSNTYNKDKIGLPFFQGKTDFGYQNPTPRTWCSNPLKIAEPLDILVSVRAPVGSVNINTESACIGRGIMSVRSKKRVERRQALREKIIHQKYLYYYFIKYEEQIEALGTGSTFKAIKKCELENLEIPLPALATQQKIAAILDKADELRQYNKQLIEKYEALTQSLFLEMFGDPVRNEKGWKKMELKKFGKIITGNTPPRNDDENYSSDFIEWLKTDNINDKYVNVTAAKEYLSEKGFSKARFVENGALLVACIAGSIQSIGRASLTNRKVSFNQQINAIQPFDDVNPNYLYFLFKISKKHIQNHASNGMKRMLTKGEFEKILMIKPSLDLQNKFSERVQMIEAQKQQAQEALEKSEALFQSLLQQAFKGELV